MKHPLSKQSLLILFAVTGCVTEARHRNHRKVRTIKPAQTEQTPQKKEQTVGKPEAPKRRQLEQFNQATTKELAQMAFDYTNEYRVSQGLKPLKWNQMLADGAMPHAENMAEGRVAFGHDGFSQRVRALPRKSWSSGENVYYCNCRGNVARQAVDGWIESDGHRENLLGDFDSLGIAVYKNSKGYWYFVQFFGTFE